MQLFHLSETSHEGSTNISPDFYDEEILLTEQPEFICPKLTIETLEQGVKYVKS